MNHFLKVLIFSSLFLSSSAFSAQKYVEAPSTSDEDLIYAIGYDSYILDAFWFGDDGVDCGEPEIKILSVDQIEQKIKFEVHPAGYAFSCEVRSMTCEVPFEKLAGKAIKIPNTYVYLYDMGCEL